MADALAHALAPPPDEFESYIEMARATANVLLDGGPAAAAARAMLTSPDAAALLADGSMDFVPALLDALDGTSPDALPDLTAVLHHLPTVISPREMLMMIQEEMSSARLRPEPLAIVLELLPTVVSRLTDHARREPLLVSLAECLADMLARADAEVLPLRACRATAAAVAAAAPHSAPAARLLLPLIGLEHPVALPDADASGCLVADGVLPADVVALANEVRLVTATDPSDDGDALSLATAYAAYLDASDQPPALLPVIVLLKHASPHVGFKGVQLVARMAGAGSLAEAELFPVAELGSLVEAVIDYMVLTENEELRDATFTWFSSSLWTQLGAQRRRTLLLHLVTRCPYPQMTALAVTWLKDVVAEASSADASRRAEHFPSGAECEAWLADQVRPALVALLAASDPASLVQRAEAYIAGLNLVRFAALRRGMLGAALDLPALHATTLAPLRQLFPLCMDLLASTKAKAEADTSGDYDLAAINASMGAMLTIDELLSRIVDLLQLDQ